MKQQRFDAAQIIGILKQQESGVPVAQICREHAISKGTFYRWKSKFGGMEVHEATRLRQLEQENSKLEKLLALAQERPRFGYRRLGVLLRREGRQINLKRVLRLYREENLKLRARKRKRVASALRVKPHEVTALNQMWSMDFLHDTLNGGRRFRALNNGVIESFNGKMRDECLNLEWFMDLHHARAIIENWRHDSNTCRPHSSLNNLPPATWAQNQLEILTLQVG